MTVSVVVIVAGRDLQLARTLDGLGRQTHRPDDVVIVRMDDAAAAVEAPADLDVVTVGIEPHGDSLPLGAARNLGAANATGRHLVFLDVDCVPATDLVARYVAVLEASPPVLACGPVRYLRNGWDVPSADLTDRALDAASEASPARPIPSSDDVVVDARHELFWSLSFGVARSTWQLLGGFDESYVGYGGEDTDLAFHARQAGVPVAWFRNGTAYHQWHPPSRFDVRRTREIVENSARFRERWGVWPMTGWLRELHDLGMVVFDERSDRLELVAT